MQVHLLDYGAGNVRSLRNAIKAIGYEIVDIVNASDISTANVIIFPGVGSFGQAMQALKEKGWTDALIEYIKADRPFFGICLGMQSLFEGSEETEGVAGLGIIKGKVTRFNNTNPTSSASVRVPQIGWNGISRAKESIALTSTSQDDCVYFVHSFCALPSADNLDWVLAVTDYGGQRYISMIQKGNVVATQFHPEKSGTVGLNILRSFLEGVSKRVDGSIGSNSGSSSSSSSSIGISSMSELSALAPTQLVKRVIACLDVRSNDAGDLVVTKGDQYDVRESGDGEGRGAVRNLGKPVSLCKRYYEDGADEVVFLNITSFRQGVISDLPMLQVLEMSSENVFVPLTVGGGIREYVDEDGVTHSSLDVAARYFRAGADKVSIGSDAVYAAEEYLAAGRVSGLTCVEQISNHYGAQAVVVSIDPKRVYVSSADDASATGKKVVKLRSGEVGPNGEEFCWWQVTVKGGRDTRDLCAVELARVCEILGAGEIMLNCIDMDGQGAGYDIPLITAVQNAVTVPVIASSGAGAVEHFSQVFQEADVLAALAAGIFHRNEVRIQDVKTHLSGCGIPARV